MAQLSDILGQLKGVAKVSKNKSIERKINDQWGIVAGKMAMQLKVDFYKDGILYLLVDNPVWSSEIEFIKPLLIQRLIQYVGTGVVKEIKVTFQPAGSESSVTVDPSIKHSLDEWVVLENKRKLDQGMVLCNRCETVYTHDGVCVFCRCQY
jgi:hypothetical protein